MGTSVSLNLTEVFAMHVYIQLNLSCTRFACLGMCTGAKKTIKNDPVFPVPNFNSILKLVVNFDG